MRTIDPWQAIFDHLWALGYRHGREIEGGPRVFPVMAYLNPTALPKPTPQGEPIT